MLANLCDCRSRVHFNGLLRGLCMHMYCMCVRAIDDLRDPEGMEQYGPVHHILHEQCMDVDFARELVQVLVEVLLRASL